MFPIILLTNFMSVQAMVDTYKNNPSFADEKTKAKVKGEYETVQEKVGEKIEMKLLITKILFSTRSARRREFCPT